jgi:hypothetical protein
MLGHGRARQITLCTSGKQRAQGCLKAHRHPSPSRSAAAAAAGSPSSRCSLLSAQVTELKSYIQVGSCRVQVRDCGSIKVMHAPTVAPGACRTHFVSPAVATPTPRPWLMPSWTAMRTCWR